MADNGKYLIGESLREKLKSTIAKVDSIPFGGPVSRIPTIIEGDGGAYVPKTFRVCTFTGSWAVNTDKVVTFRGVTTTPNTVSARNEIVSLPTPKSPSASRLVNIAKDGTQWYLVSFQMAAATAVLASSTQTITYATPGTNVTALVGVTASLNTANCSISISAATTSIRTVGSTQTAVIVTGTATATYVTLEI